MIVTVIAFVLASLLSLMLVPALSLLARRVGLIDVPDNNRKLHQNAIPMVGGLAMFIAVPVAVVLVILLGWNYPAAVQSITESVGSLIPIDQIKSVVPQWHDSAGNINYGYIEMLGLFFGATVLMAVGLADDRFGIRGRQKLLGQFLAVSVLVVFGFKFDRVEIFGQPIEFGSFAVLVVYAWMIAAINSVNLLDGADGIASTIGIVMSLAICVMSLAGGMVVDAVLAAAIAGALLGFLKFNFPPAKAYLGDSGSMLIGFLLSALAIRCMFKSHTAYAFFAPIALLAIPFIDTGAAIIRRRLTGRSIFEVDRGHLHHALMKRGYTPRVSLLWVALLCTTTAAGAVLSLMEQRSEYALASIVIVVVVMIGCKIFGVAEYQLVSRKASSLARSFFKMTANHDTQILQSSVHVQGNRNWQELWKLLCDFADEHQLNQLTLDLNMPWLHESFHATRRRADADRGENKEWFTMIPLIIDGRSFGRIEINGAFGQKFDHHTVIQNLLKVTQDIEQSLVEPKEIESQVPLEASELQQPAGTSF